MSFYHSPQVIHDSLHIKTLHLDQRQSYRHNIPLSEREGRRQKDRGRLRGRALKRNLFRLPDPLKIPPLPASVHNTAQSLRGLNKHTPSAGLLRCSSFQMYANPTTIQSTHSHSHAKSQTSVCGRINKTHMPLFTFPPHTYTTVESIQNISNTVGQQR